MARTAGFAPGEAAKGREAVLALADRIMDLYEHSDPMAIASRELKSMFMFLQWRVARMCRMRADAADKAGDLTLAMAESEACVRQCSLAVAGSSSSRNLGEYAVSARSNLRSTDSLSFGDGRMLADPRRIRRIRSLGLSLHRLHSHHRSKTYLI